MARNQAANPFEKEGNVTATLAKISQEEGDADMLYNLGLQELKKENQDAGLDLLQRAIQVEPLHGLSLLRYGMHLYNLGDFEGAEPLLKTASREGISADPAMPTAKVREVATRALNALMVKVASQTRFKKSKRAILESLGGKGVSLWESTVEEVTPPLQSPIAQRITQMTRPLHKPRTKRGRSSRVSTRMGAEAWTISSWKSP